MLENFVFLFSFVKAFCIKVFKYKLIIQLILQLNCNLPNMSNTSSQILTSNIMAVILLKAATHHKEAVIHHKVVIHPLEDTHPLEDIHRQGATLLVVTLHNQALSFHLQRAVAMAPMTIPKVNQRISLSTIWAYAKDLFVKSTWSSW